MVMYRCHYVRHPIYVNVGSRALGEQYQRAGGWPESALVWSQAYPLPDGPPQLFTVSQLHTTHAVVHEIEAGSLEQVYGMMQADAWSYHESEMFAQRIDDLGLTHSSMSIGDVVEDISVGRYVECEMPGWRELAQK